MGIRESYPAIVAQIKPLFLPGARQTLWDFAISSTWKMQLDKTDKPTQK
jgi:hypothetical protein